MTFLESWAVILGAAGYCGLVPWILNRIFRSPVAFTADAHPVARDVLPLVPYGGDTGCVSKTLWPDGERDAIRQLEARRRRSEGVALTRTRVIRPFATRVNRNGVI